MAIRIAPGIYRCPACGEDKEIEEYRMRPNGRWPRGYCIACESWLDTRETVRRRARMEERKAARTMLDTTRRENQPMISTYDLFRQPGAVIDEVRQSGVPLVVTERKRPAFVMVALADFEGWLALKGGDECTA